MIGGQWDAGTKNFPDKKNIVSARGIAVSSILDVGCTHKTIVNGNATPDKFTMKRGLRFLYAGIGPQALLK
jgi:hypothetical protein